MSEDHLPEDGEDAIVIENYVADCPIDAELAGQLVGLADLPWRDPDVTSRAMRALGWTADGAPTDETRFVTAAGHAVYGDYCLYMPFVHYYTVGGELWPDDFWGSQPGWSSQPDAGRQDFEACVDAAIDRFAERLGPPEWDVRTEGRNISIGSFSWRYAAWRRSGNILVVGPTLDGYSYSQDEEAVVYISEFAQNRPFPAAAEFLSLMRAA